MINTQGVVEQIEHWVTQHGNLQPVLVIGNSHIPLKNYAVLNKHGIWVGDCISITVTDQVDISKLSRAIDSTPVQYPDHCPACGHRLFTTPVDRGVVIQCRNTACPAQQDEEY